MELDTVSASARPRHLSKRIARSIQVVGDATAEAAHAAADKAHDVGEKVVASKAIVGTKQVAQTVGQKAAGASLAVGGAAADAGHSIGAKVVQVGAATGSATLAVGRGAKTKAATAGTAIAHGAVAAGEATLGVATGAGRIAAGAGQAAIEKTVAATNTVGRVAQGTGHAVAEKAGQAKVVAGQSAHSVVVETTQRAGQVAEWLMQNPALQGFVKTLKVDGVLNLLARVDLDKAQATVQDLQKQYPHATPEQLARRLTGMAAALTLTTTETSADWATIALLQAELIAQIACAYGLDVHEPARKGEFIAIFGLALGREWAIQIGRELLRPVPVSGTLLAALANAGVVSLIGRAARRFYASHLHLRPSLADLEAAASNNAIYLRRALAPQAPDIADFLEFRT